MKKLLLAATFCLLPLLMFAQNYVFFLHNKFLEDEGINGVHPEYGKAEYNEIVNKFRKEGLIVISEVRGKNTNGVAYAHKIIKQVDSLLKRGVKPERITVIGTSKGGYIAQLVSGYIRNRELNFVFIGSCDEDEKEMPDVQYYGNILSIYEKTDKWLSCQKMKVRSGKHVNRFKEIELNTGMKHGFLYKALDAWIKPAAQWAKQHYQS